MILLGALAIFLTVLLGTAILGSVGRQLGRIGWLSLGACTGLLALSAIVIVIDLSPLRIDRVSFWVVTGLLGLLSVRVLATRKLDPFPVGPRFRPYEWIPTLALVVVVLLEIWKVAPSPIGVRDTVVGADLVATYAVKEGTIASRVFTGPELVGKLSAQPFYMPFTMTQQIAWRLVGFPMGKLWLPLLLVGFLLTFFTWLRRRIHPLLAGCAIVALISTPMLFTFSGLISTDFPNAVFFGLAALFGLEHSRDPSKANRIGLATFLGAAVWTRAETILLVPLVVLVDALAHKGSWRARAKLVAFLSVPSLIAVLVWHGFYLEFRLPGAPETSFMIEPKSGAAMKEILGSLFGYFTSPIFGFMFFFAALVFLLEAALSRRKFPWRPFLWILLTLAGLIVILWIFRAAYVSTTGKRGLLRTLPLIIVFLAASPMIARLSAWLYRAEYPDLRPREEPLLENVGKVEVDEVNADQADLR